MIVSMNTMNNMDRTYKQQRGLKENKKLPVQSKRET